MYEKLHDLQTKASKFDLHLIIVGGAVRDKILLNNDSSDIDIEVHPLGVGVDKDTFLKNYHEFAQEMEGKSLPYEIYKFKFIEYDIEISPPRIETFIDGDDGHKNFEIEITTSKNLGVIWKRRDFTINSIGYDLLNLKVVDPLGGVLDLENKTLKPVGENFSKDYVRFFRGIRFSILFGLDATPVLGLKYDFSFTAVSLFHFVKEALKSKNFFKFITLCDENISALIKDEKVLELLECLKKITNEKTIINNTESLEVFISKLPQESRDQIINLITPTGIISKKRIKKL
tara:strand:- start:7938 stop:8801 length:864 start_codon:yes stop_codon:yes gene_type:complete